MNSAEATVVGILLNRPAELGRALELGVRSTHFVEPDMRRVFDLVVAAEAAGQPRDFTALVMSMGTSSATMLTDLLTETTTAEMDVWAPELLCEAWVREARNVIKTLSLRFANRQAFETVDSLRAWAVEALDTVLRSVATAGTATSTSAVLHQVLEQIEASIVAGEAGQRTVKSGLKALDKTVGGFAKGRMYVVGARPGMGKSALVTHIARTAVKDGFKTWFYSVEMTSEEIVGRMLAAEANISQTDIQAAWRLTDSAIDRLMVTTPLMAHWPLWLDHKFGRDVTAIIASARAAHRRGQLDLVVVDYIQLLRAPGKWSSRHHEVGEISSAFKALALELDVPVIVVAQLNREADEAKDGPGLWHLKDSGSIEQDADCVLLLYREGYYQESARQDEAWIIVAKNRGGTIGRVGVDVDLATCRFIDRPLQRMAQRD